MFTKTLAVAALAAAPALASFGPGPAVNVYWGASKGPDVNTDRLRDYCDSTGFEYVTLGFVNVSPEHDPSNLGYPGLNVANHCVSQKYLDSNGKESLLLAECGWLSADLRYCQKQGKKVLLSVGGTWQANSDYSISSAANGEAFADFIWGAFGPYDKTWQKARPFDDFYQAVELGDEPHFVFDGFDFDIEKKFGQYSSYLYPLMDGKGVDTVSQMLRTATLRTVISLWSTSSARIPTSIRGSL